MATSRNFLVPHDFTSVGDSAAMQGAYLAKDTQAVLSLMHVVKGDKNKPEAEAKLKAVKETVAEKFPNLTIKIYVIKGSIFTEIGKTAESLRSSLIIMGTHGAKGMQKVFGSFAMRVITSTSIPFLIVQNNKIIKSLKKIVFPLGIEAETLQIMGFSSILAAAYKAEMHLVAEKHTDTKFKNKTKINFQVVGKRMAANNVDYKMTLLDDKGNYESKILNYAKKVDADVIAISYYNENIIPQLDKFAQHIITNEHDIPSLIINSKQVSSPYF